MKISLGKIRALLITAALACVLCGMSQAQDPVPRFVDAYPKAKPAKRKELPKKEWAPLAQPQPPSTVHFGGGTFEKSIAVDPKINVTLCVTQGDVKINGWSRSEVRVFVKDGSQIGFNIVDAGRQGGKPVWIKVVGSDPKKPAASKECLWGGAVELDVPTGATLKLEGRTTRTIVDSIRRVTVNNAGGNISIRNVSEGVDASTYQGDVDVENSSGTITLNTTDGNIVGFELAPSEVGDIFRAKTNGGTISLQHLEHRQVEVKSISGSIVFNGALLNAGIYNIGTSNGSIVLGLPSAPACFLSATFGFGRFDSEIPVKIITDNVTPGPIKSIKGTLGDSEKRDCKLNLTSSSGNIRIRKQ